MLFIGRLHAHTRLTARRYDMINQITPAHKHKVRKVWQGLTDQAFNFCLTPPRGGGL